MIEIPDSKDFTDARKETSFGKLISNTNYARMSLDNEFTHDTDTFIGKKGIEADFHFIITISQNVKYGVWYSEMYREFYISNKLNGNALLNITCEIDLVNNNTTYVRNPQDNFGLFKIVKAFKKNELRFESLEIRKNMYDFFKKVKVF